MAFHNVRLPEDVERGAKGGPRFKTTVLPLASGHEKRNMNWEHSRGEWDVGYGIQYDTDLTRVINFFYARKGRGHSFRFKDWTDFTMVQSFIALGDGVTTVFQTYKTYENESFLHQRPITKLVGTQILYIDAVVVPSGYTIDVNTGIITFTSAPILNGEITLTSEFDCHVRFDSDMLDISAETFETGAIPAIKILEIKAEI